jgi:glycosyltransferase involved in cell wall biosynthesis
LAASTLAVGVDARELQGRPTGTGRYLRNLLREWKREPTIRLILYSAGETPADALLDDPRVSRRPLGSAATHPLWWQERLLPRAVRADGIDVFFSPAYTCPLRVGVPRVTAVHDLSYFSFPEDFTLLHAARRRLTVSASLRASRRILACSEFTKREISTRFPALADRVLHVPLGPDDDLPPPPVREDARRRLGVSGPFVVTVGSVFNRRCLPELLRATSLLARRWPGIVLDVVGENRTSPPLDLPGAVREQGLLARVRLSGFVDEAGLADRYAAADAAVFLSEYEGFGLPAMEAAARGVPLVVSTRPALSEVFEGAALLVDPRNEAAIAEALDRLLGDPALRAGLVLRGFALAARHSWTRTAALTHGALVAAAGS